MVGLIRSLQATGRINRKVIVPNAALGLKCSSIDNDRSYLDNHGIYLVCKMDRNHQGEH